MYTGACLQWQVLRFQSLFDLSREKRDLSSFRPLTYRFCMAVWCKAFWMIEMKRQETSKPKKITDFVSIQLCGKHQFAYDNAKIGDFIDIRETCA